MRIASEQNFFPYTLSTLCYIEVKNSGEVYQAAHKNKSDRPLLKQTYDRVLAGESRLFAVWPGQYRSDLFIIDDLTAFAKAFEI